MTTNAKAINDNNTSTAKAAALPKYKVYADLNALKADMDSAVKASKSLQTKIQVIAWGIMCHAVKHKDWTPANTLIATFITELGDGVRKDALVEWFKLAGLTVNEAQDGFDGWKGAEYIRDNADKLKSTMWYSLKKSSPFKGFDLKEAIAQLVKRAKQQQEAKNLAIAGEAKKDAKVTADNADSVVVDLELLAQLEALTK